MRELVVWLAILGAVVALIVGFHRARFPPPAPAEHPTLATRLVAPSPAPELNRDDDDDEDQVEPNADGLVIGGDSGGRCSDGWCWQSPLPDGDHISTLWGSGPDDVWGAGEHVSHWDGKSWTAGDAGENDAWSGLHGCAPNDVWLVGLGGAIKHFDGTAWRTSLRSKNRLAAVWCRAHDDVWVAGGRGLLQHFDGRSWSTVSLPQKGLLLRFVVRSATDAWLLGANSTIVHFDGTNWTTQALNGLTRPSPSADEGSLIDAMVPENLKNAFGAGFAAAPDDLWVAGYRGLHHFNGRTWSPIDLGTRRSITAMWGFSSSDIWAAGERLWHWDGSRWSQKKGAGRIVSALWGAAPGDLWLATPSGMIRWDGHKLVRATPSARETLYAVWASGPDDAWAAGDGSTVGHFSGGKWRVVATGETKGQFHQIFASGPDDVWFAGQSLFHWDGKRLAKRSVLEPGDDEHVPDRELRLFGGFARGRGDYWFCGTDGLFSYDGTATKHVELVHAEGELASCDHVWGAGSELWATFGQVLWHSSGGAWSKVELPKHDELRGLSGSGAADVWLHDKEGTLFHFDGRAWVRTPTPAKGGFSTGVFVAGPHDAWAWGFQQKGATEEEAATIAEVLDVPLSSVDRAELGRDVLLRWDGRVWSAAPWPEHATVLGGVGQSVWLAGMSGSILFHSPR